MTWLENAILGTTLDVTGWDQLYQALPFPGADGRVREPKLRVPSLLVQDALQITNYHSMFGEFINPVRESLDELIQFPGSRHLLDFAPLTYPLFELYFVNLPGSNFSHK